MIIILISVQYNGCNVFLRGKERVAEEQLFQVGEGEHVRYI